MSQRSICKLLCINRATVWKQSQKAATQHDKLPNDQQPQDQVSETVDQVSTPNEAAPAPSFGQQVLEKTRELVRTYPTWGYRRIWAWLRFREQLPVNKKRIERLMREQGWQVRKRIETPRPRVTSSVSACERLNERWAVDMTSSWSQEDGWIGITAVIDCFSREVVGLRVSKNGRAVEATSALEDACLACFGLVYPKGEERPVLRSDNGPEFISQAVTIWAASRTALSYIPPGQPWHNGYVESFNARLRDECLNINSFYSLLHAQVIIGDWKHQYNYDRRHSSLGYIAPADYAQTCTHVKQKNDSHTVWI